MKQRGAEGISKSRPVGRDRGGRPMEYGPRIVQDICEALRAGNTRRAAARYAGIAWCTFNKWMGDEDKPEFAPAVEEAEARCQVGLVTTLLQKARRGDVNALRFFLERRFPDDWKERTEATVVVEEDVSVEELERLFAATLAERGLPGLVAEPDGGAAPVAGEGLAHLGETEPASA